MKAKETLIKEEAANSDLGAVSGIFSTDSSIPALKLNQTGGELKLDKHPMTGRARISINTWSFEDDGWGGEEMEYDSAAFILTLNDCIKLRDQLTERIEKDLFCALEDKKLRCKTQCSDCRRIQAGLPD